MTENLWAPWRMAYINKLEDEENPDPQGQPQAPPPCFLCEAAQFQDTSPQARDRLILQRDDRGIILLNRFPYTSGHLLVAPKQHLADLTELTPTQRADLIELTTFAQRIITHAYNPQGVNIGVNLGRCAGAGLPGHLHVHIVPRWAGDTNFMQVTGQVRVIPEAIEASYQRLHDAMTNLPPD